MADMSDGEGWTDMETTQTKMARKKNHGLKKVVKGRAIRSQSVKKKKTVTNGNSKEEWIVIITISNDKEHFHPVQVTKAIEKAIGEK